MRRVMGMKTTDKWTRVQKARESMERAAMWLRVATRMSATARKRALSSLERAGLRFARAMATPDKPARAGRR